MKPITTSVYTFENLIHGGFVYVDKTDRILELLKPAFAQYFLARPRRFGKSLLISTLQAIFEGKRELFKGLAIEPLWDWSRTWPVIRLDLGSCQCESVEDLRDNLDALLRQNSERLQVPLRETASVTQRFLCFMGDVAARSVTGQVVLLVDEYDKPLIGRIGKKNVLEFQRELKGFYSVVKTQEPLQRFTFVTGVSKFSKVSIFSDLNNLTDLTLSPLAATLVGYTHREVRENFASQLQALAEKLGLNVEAVFERLVRWYDGYRFHHASEPLFNPVSVGRCLSEYEFANYWYETGTPTFLVELLKERPVKLDHLELEALAFSTYEPADPQVLPLLLQTGYLTIKGAHEDGEARIYHLDFPNLEVGKSFSDSLMSAYSGLSGNDSVQVFARMVSALREDDVGEMLDALSLFFANVPANITLRNEKYYQSLFYAVFTLLGARIQAECWTNIGRIDAVVETATTVFVFEFKLDDTEKQALRQIHERRYYEKYVRPGRKLVLVGVAFDSKMRNLSDREVEIVKCFH